VFSVRLPAKLRYAVELTARLNHEPMTDVIVRALNDAVSSENGGLFVEMPGHELPVFLLPKVWDERESVRLVKLALIHPALLSARERALWERIRDDPRYWAAGPESASNRAIEQLRPDRLEVDWSELASASP
jgi:hypothetical protein